MIRHPVDSADAAELRERGEDQVLAPGEDQVLAAWCGQCDQRTRHVELPDGRLGRCRNCHPAGRHGRCPEPGCAFRWSDGVDRPCRLHADLHPDLYASTRPRP